MTLTDDLAIYYSAASGSVAGGGQIMQFERLVRIAKSGEFFRHIFRYRDVTLHAPELYAFPLPFLTAVICRLLARRGCAWVDQKGKRVKIGPAVLLRELFTLCREYATYKRVLAGAEAQIDALLQRERPDSAFNPGLTPVYLRSDLAYGYIAGGSIGHIAGVLNNLNQCGLPDPVFVSSDTIATVLPDVKTFFIREPVHFRNVRDIAGLLHNAAFFAAARQALGNRQISMVYHRSALNSYAGVLLADAYNVPYVLEYNGSEVWVARHWGERKLKAVSISEKIERLTFARAQLIVCVSKPLKDELMERGVPESKILVNPNGVNPDVYRPDLDGAPVREQCGIPLDAPVIGFIGTFGAWHGAEVLAEAFTRLAPDCGGSPLYLLLIGDGLRLPEVKNILLKAGVLDRCVLTGMIPQAQGPAYLAACDILVSPQLRNPDGTPFFGSPTKMFEYMAMGKGIAASNLDQMGEVLTDGQTALLCEPGNRDELQTALEHLLASPDLRTRLGRTAREEVLARHTWWQHTQRIIERLKELLPDMEM
jgi:glycosyltransferase involved in cell wall biosynthesis